MFFPRQDTAWRVNKQQWLIVTQATRKYFYMEIWLRARLHRSKPPMCKSLVLKEMPLNEAKHSEPLRIRYSKISVLSPPSKEHRGPRTVTEYPEGSWHQKLLFHSSAWSVSAWQRTEKNYQPATIKLAKRESLLMCVGQKTAQVSVTASFPKCCPSTEHSLPLTEAALEILPVAKRELW